VRTILQVGRLAPDQAQISLMHQSGALHGAFAVLGLKMSVRNAAQLIVNEGKYLLERLRVTLFPLEE
jgi:hypothetical protein